jgi:hypothetical protein
LRFKCAVHGLDEAVEARVAAASDAEFDRLYDLLTSRPTTLAGGIAILDHLARPQYGEPSGRLRETILSGAVGWGGGVKEAALDLPRVLADTMRSLLGEQLRL